MHASNTDTANSPRSILIIDDEEMIRDLARDVLEMDGFSTIPAKNGIEGVKIFKKNRERIACVILDLTMPRMSGEETYCKLKEIDANVKIILSTGHSKNEATHEIVKLGVHGVIQKPYRIEELLQMVRKIVNV